jgi:hypothetical protein
MSIPKNGITADRKSQDKLDYIIDNYEHSTRLEIASAISESPRWVKRQIKLLKEKGLLYNKREIQQELIWPEEVSQKAVTLRENKLMSSEGISEVLIKEFGFCAPEYTIEHHLLHKLKCKFPTKEEWLVKNLPYEYAKRLIEEGMRISDISDILKKDLGVYISDDIILIYIKKIGLVSLREFQVNKVNEKVNSVDRAWLEGKISGKISMANLCKEIGASKTVVIRKLHREDLKIPNDRKIWSNNLEFLRDSLINIQPPSFTMNKDDIHQCILGWLAGDGSLDKNGRFVVNHSLSQLSYLYVKKQVLYNYFSNAVTVPAQHYSMADSTIYLGGKEQLGLSCSGLVNYLPYLKSDGSKNFEKIIAELIELGWACYYMDDGSF